MINESEQKGTAVPDFTADEETLAGTLLHELRHRMPENIAVGAQTAREIARALIAGGAHPVAAVVSNPLTPRECAQHAAQALTDATHLAKTGIAGDGPDRARALVAVADGYRTLGATIRGAADMQPEQEGTN